MKTASKLTLRLRAERKRANMSQQRLAELSNYTRGYVSRIEIGSSDACSLKALEIFAAALGIHPGRLLGYPHPPPDEMEAERQTAIDLVLSLPPERLREAAAILGVLQGDNARN